MLVRKTALTRPHRRIPSPDTPADYQMVGTLRYYVPGLKREFDYSPLRFVLKMRLATSLAEAHVEYLGRFSRAYAVSCFFALRRFAEFASAGDSSLSQVKSLYSGAGAKLWRSKVAAYVANLERRRTALTTFAEEIGNLFRGLDALASRGLAAKCERPKLPKNYHASGKHRPGLVEQSNKNPVAPQLLAQLRKHIDSLNLPIKGIEADELLQAVAAQVPVDVLHDEIAVAEAIFRINAKALGDVRASAEAAFVKWRDVWLKGQSLLGSPGLSVSIAVRRAKELPKNKSGAPLQALFAPELGDVAVGNFLRFFYEEFGPFVPSGVELTLPSVMRKAFWKLGGLEYFDAHFALHRRAVAAAVILYLVDSGANVSAALSLTTESEQATDDRNFVDFISFKDRAGPEPIIKQLPLTSPEVKVTAAQALRDVKRMTQARREMFPKLLGSTLFVYRFFKEPSTFNDGVLADNFSYMLRESQMPRVWTPSAIRIAVGIEVSGKTNGDLDKVARKLSHTVDSATTPIYGLRLAVRLLLARKIREYQTLLEAALATQSPIGPELLGYSTETAAFLVDKAVRTGLGFLCRDATARGGKIEKDGATCPDLGKSCADCHVRVFMADAESLAEMVAVNETLSKKLDEAGDGVQDAWADNWLDLYAFSTAVIHKAKRSRFAYLMPTARVNAQKMLAAGFDPTLVRG